MNKKKNYYLRVEGVNLSNFVMDTNDLSTIRGGSLLLLWSMDRIEEVIEETMASFDPQQPVKTNKTEKNVELLKTELRLLKNKKLSKAERRRGRKRLEKQIERKRKASAEQQEQAFGLPEPTVTNGRLWLTISKGASWGLFQLDIATEEAIAVQQAVVSALNTEREYKHATFIVDLHKNDGEKKYQQDRNSIQTLNRWQQMQAPSIAIPSPDMEVCDFDKIRPARSDKLVKKDKHISSSVDLRRTFGIEYKPKFYQKITGISGLNFTNDFNQISSDETKGVLDGKIAFIYIDGNRFGARQKNSKKPEQQRVFDHVTRNGREDVLKEILLRIKDKPDWLWEEEGKKRIRMETLLWGGDEIIWVVPAWQGWWLLRTFYQQAQKYIKLPTDSQPLKHAAGLVFCHHNAPIKRIDKLAGNLADGFAKTGQNREKNMIAYQVLESFDHAGSDLNKYRDNQTAGIGTADNLLVEAENMVAIQNFIQILKSDEMDFPRRKMYKILHAYQQGDMKKVEKYEKELPDASRQPLQELQKLFGNTQAHWLHLIDLWDYVPTSTNKEESSHA